MAYVACDDCVNSCSERRLQKGHIVRIRQYDRCRASRDVFSFGFNVMQQISYTIGIEAKACSGKHLPVFSQDAVIEDGCQIPCKGQIKDTSRRTKGAEKARNQDIRI